MRTPIVWASRAMVLTALLVSACHGDKAASTAPAHSVAVSVTPSVLTVACGSAGQVSIALVRGGGFAGAVSLAVSGLPSGVTVTLNPSQLTGASLLATIDVAVAANTTPGTYAVTVTATSTLGSTTATYSLTVNPAPDYTLSAATAPVTVTRGASAATPITLTRIGGFVGAVALTASNLPAGLQATFDPASVVGTTSTLTLSAATTAVAGDYTVSVGGTATGISPHSATLLVRIVDPPDFALALSSASGTVDRGSSITTTVQLTRSGGFAGTVALSLPDAPAGISGTFTPNPAPGSTSTLTITVGAQVAGGTIALTVQGIGDGVGTRSATYALTVTIPPAIAMSPADSTVDVVQFTSVDVPLRLTRTNYSGNVSFAASGAPAGMTLTFAPTSTAGTGTTLTASVALSVPPGTYPLTVTASGSNGLQVTATVRVRVTATTGAVAQYEFCSAAALPVFFAFQDGNGAWREITPTVSGNTAHFRFPITANFGGVTFITRTGATTYESYHVYLTKNEILTQGPSWCSQSFVTAAVNGTISGLAVGEWGRVAIGSASMSISGPSVSPIGYRFSSVYSGAQDLIASRTTGAGTVDRFVIQRDVTVTDGIVVPNIDFNGPNAVVAGNGVATVTNGMGEWLTSYVVYQTANGLTGTITNWSNFSTATTRGYATVPPAARRTGDVMAVHVRASASMGPTLTDVREAIVAADPGTTSVQVALGSRALPTTATTAALAPYLRARLQGDLPADLRTIVSIELHPVAGGNSAILGASNDYMAIAGSRATYDLTIPDLSGLNGFPLASVLGRGQYTMTSSAGSVSGGLDINPLQPLRPGLQVLWARTYRVVTF